MESTEIIRKIDELGRIVLPIEIRRSLNLREKDDLEIVPDENGIFLKPVYKEKSCIFCNDETGLIPHDDRYICKSCLAEINKQV